MDSYEEKSVVNTNMVEVSILITRFLIRVAVLAKAGPGAMLSESTATNKQHINIYIDPRGCGC